jgi:hypothetical protein
MHLRTDPRNASIPCSASFVKEIPNGLGNMPSILDVIKYSLDKMRLCSEFEAFGLSQIPEVAADSLGKQISQEPLEVPVKPVGDIRAVHDLAEKCWQKRRSVIAASSLEDVEQAGRPRCSSEFIAIHVDVTHDTPGFRSAFVQDT